jgi:hypothetical protein
MTNKLLTYLRENSLSNLEINHGVIARRSKDNSKFSLNYDQFSSRPGDEIAELCRGIVLRPLTESGLQGLASDNWQDVILGDCYYLARTMKRFYNHGEFYAAKLDFSCPNLRVMDKLDGTMTALYFDNVKDSWFVATRSVSEANLPFDQLTNMTFSDLFWQGYENTISPCRDTSILDKRFTYIFETTSALNKIVVSYDKPEVTLLALVENLTGREVDVYSQEGLNLLSIAPRPKMHTLSSIDDIISFINSQPPNQCEGVVLCDGNFNRLKVKSAAYVLAHRAKDMLDTSPSAALLSVLDGTIDDILPLLENELRIRFEKIRNAVSLYFSHLDGVFHEVLNKTNSRKEFAIYITKTSEWTAPLFAMLKMHEEDKSIMVTSSNWVSNSLKSNRWTSSMTLELLKRIACYMI